MTFKSNILCFLTAAFLLSGCTSYKKVPYLQNSATVNVPAGEIPLYDARIMPKDLLTITVSTTDPQASVPFKPDGTKCSIPKFHQPDFPAHLAAVSGKQRG